MFQAEPHKCSCTFYILILSVVVVSIQALFVIGFYLNFDVQDVDVMVDQLQLRTTIKIDENPHGVTLY